MKRSTNENVLFRVHSTGDRTIDVLATSPDEVRKVMKETHPDWLIKKVKLVKEAVQPDG